MNIFVVDRDPVQAAKELVDRHIVKMPLESAQIACTVLHGKAEVPYKPTHRKHPAVLWAGMTQGNFDWLIFHGLGLCFEYARRYGRVHASEKVLHQVAELGHLLPEGKRTPFALCMPEEFKSDDPVISYRNYYTDKLRKKPHLARWASGRPPAWLPADLCP